MGPRSTQGRLAKAHHGRWFWTFHSLCHVFATWALHDARIRIEDLSRLLGHSSTRVTQDALGVLRAAGHLSRRIPGDVTVTGWDDTSQVPPAGLTTIAQSLRDQGAHCARLALDETPDHPYKPDWTLIRRESTSRVTG